MTVNGGEKKVGTHTATAELDNKNYKATNDTQQFSIVSRPVYVVTPTPVPVETTTTTETTTEATTQATTEVTTIATSQATTEAVTETTTNAPIVTTEAHVETTTEAPTENTTIAPAEPTTVAPVTEEQTEETTESPAPYGKVVQLARVERPVTKNLKDGIQITWKGVEYGREYEIFRKKEDGNLRKIGITDKLVFFDDNVKHNVLYTYYVRAKSYVDEDVYYVRNRVSKGRKQVFVKRSGKVTISKKNGTISWKASKNYVDGYQLLVADNVKLKKGQKFTVGNVTMVTFKDLPKFELLPAGTYYVGLRQYIMRGGKRYVSAYHGARKYVKK